jgi:hypothetical protein
MKTILFLSLIFLTQISGAQTEVNKTIAVQLGQKVILHFDYPEVIRVSTWEKNEVSVQASVSLNNGENDDAFELQTTTTGNTISIKNEIRNMKSLPQHITIVDGSEKMTFKNKDAFRKYQQTSGKTSFDRMSNGVDMDIQIEIKVPRNIETRIESIYGMVEVKDFVGPITVDATYGGIDAALFEKTTGEVIAETNYGQIYTNLDIKFSGEKSHVEDFHTYVSAKPGVGSRYDFESKYGNVYLRKAK